MEPISSEVVGIIYQLLPGFVAAWVFYRLTSYPKPAPFERVVQALIYTVIVRAIVIVSKWTLGPILPGLDWFPSWNSELELVFSIFVALGIGVVFSWCVSNDFPTSFLRKDERVGRWRVLRWFQRIFSKLNLTKRTMHPTEWYSFLNTGATRFIVLHLRGKKRLMGWPRYYPNEPDSGHFIIESPKWLLKDGTIAELASTYQMLVPVSDIERIELMKWDDEFGVPDKAKYTDSMDALKKLHEQKGVSND